MSANVPTEIQCAAASLPDSSRTRGTEFLVLSLSQFAAGLIVGGLFCTAHRARQEKKNKSHRRILHPRRGDGTYGSVVSINFPDPPPR